MARSKLDLRLMAERMDLWERIHDLQLCKEITEVEATSMKARLDCEKHVVRREIEMLEDSMK